MDILRIITAINAAMSESFREVFPDEAEGLQYTPEFMERMELHLLDQTNIDPSLFYIAFGGLFGQVVTNAIPGASWINECENPVDMAITIHLQDAGDNKAMVVLHPVRTIINFLHGTGIKPSAMLRLLKSASEEKRDWGKEGAITLCAGDTAITFDRPPLQQQEEQMIKQAKKMLGSENSKPDQPL